MVITERSLEQIMPNVRKNVSSNPNLKGYTFTYIVSLINKYSYEFDIDTPKRMRHFLAQIAHECLEFRYTEEIASGSAYEGRKDLGNTRRGDGKKFKGRGCIQITGRFNYTKYKDFCGFDVVSQPELLSKPVGAIRSAMWFWKTHGLNELADEDKFTAITKRINGGTNGIENRKIYLNRAQKCIV